MEQELREVPLTSCISSCLMWGKRSMETGGASELKYNYREINEILSYFLCKCKHEGVFH